jgi:hypothetical protein
MPNVAEVIRDHVTLTVECVDRLYLNGYVPGLQREDGVVAFLRHRRPTIASPALFAANGAAFKANLQAFCQARGIPWIEFAKGERKDEVVQRYREQFPADEGVVPVGVAQEKAKTWTATKQVQGRMVHFSFRWRTVYVNHYYIYLIDREWGPAFIKICGYAPYALKVCLNGHEWAKRQATRQGIPFEALDNGFLACADPTALQAVCDALTAEAIQTFFESWLACLPLPLTADDQAAGFRYRLSIMQLEVSRTQVFDDPLRGRDFFEEFGKSWSAGRSGSVQELVVCCVRVLEPFRAVDAAGVPVYGSPQPPPGRGRGALGRAPDGRLQVLRPVAGGAALRSPPGTAAQTPFASSHGCCAADRVGGHGCAQRIWSFHHARGVGPFGCGERPDK